MQEGPETDMSNDPLCRAQARDLPLEVTALIDTTMARETGVAPRRRPVLPIRAQSVQGAALSLSHLNGPKRSTRVLALEDLVFVGLFVGLLLTAWISLLIGINLAQAAEHRTRMCIGQADHSVRTPSLPGRNACARLPNRT